MADHDGDATPRRAARLILGGIAAGALLGTGIAAPTQAAAPEPTTAGSAGAGAAGRTAKTVVMDAEVLQSLAAKLDGLELSDPEREALTRLLSAAADQIGRTGTGTGTGTGTSSTGTGTSSTGTAFRATATGPRKVSATSMSSFAEQFDTAFTPGAMESAMKDEAIIVITGLGEH